MKILCIGDAMIPGAWFTEAAEGLGTAQRVTADWETDWGRLQHRRLVVEHEGPAVEEVPPVFRAHPDAEIALALFCPFSAEGMDAFENLRLIGVARAGVENVDVRAATERDILVVNVMGRNAEAVSDFAIGLLLSEARNIARAHAAIKSGTWRKEFSNSAHIPELKGKTVGIVGFGYIGRLVARKLSGFDVRVLVYDPYVQPQDVEGTGVHRVDKETLFAEADFVTIHARLTPESRGLVGRAELARMKPTAYLINTARAGLVDTDALVEALREKRIAGAALDVFDVEPIPAGHPLLELDNVTLTSHLAGTTREALTRSPYLLVEEVARVLDGQPTRSLKNPEVLDRPAVQAWLRKARAELGRAR
ncbi:2-hydroxyacid dehydrogenase [Caldinitratiruptor microaerophilus]|uniref:D-3-phosphoglycerate dehydrogenase n=1 Tax=Caldinitratiruptor microaerophilus TaxID=671077 RepID=A0AA35CMI4_9FIRM|nr:2-hydroxyacid dehydrogenase [Caldinitratiruptor microaerophilus]BDG62054.1 hypothetical protein caldi_31440 [Caldinitratiruptor microaerophilus]